MTTSAKYLHPWRDSRIEVRYSPIHGQGMFACAPVKAGEVVLIWGGTVFTEAEIRAGKANPLSMSILDEGLYLADTAKSQDSVDYYLNHSCDPNVWMQDAITLIARRNIEPNEELTADYAMWEADPTWIIHPCQCGAKLCRGKVTGAEL